MIRNIFKIINFNECLQSYLSPQKRSSKTQETSLQWTNFALQVLFFAFPSFFLDKKRSKKIKAVEEILEIHSTSRQTNPNSSLFQKCQTDMCNTNHIPTFLKSFVYRDLSFAFQCRDFYEFPQRPLAMILKGKIPINHLNTLQLSGLKQALIAFTLSFSIVIINVNSSNAQTLYSEEQLIAAALRYHPDIKASQWAIEEKRHLEKSAFSLPSPNIYTQSPAGTFYTIGINQNIDFPTVYSHQKKVFQAETRLAESQSLLSQQQLTWEIRNAYNSAQYAATRLQLLARQDSLLSSYAEAAQKKYAAGEIDFVEKSFAQLQFGKIHQQLLLAQSEYDLAVQDIMLLSGVTEEFDVAAYTEEELKKITENVTQTSASNAQLIIAQNQSDIAQERIKLEKSRAMPGFQLGYLNQVAKNSPIQYRFQAGITLPLWWWQYAGRIKSAKANAEKAAFEQESVMLSFKNSQGNAIINAEAARNQLKYYIDSGLAEVEALEKSSERFHLAGERDLTTHLRTLNDVMDIRFNYAQAARQLMDALALLKYMNGSNQ
jgi:cobalt-zinc-cadmium efflux system outer membrane protein